MCTQVSVCLYAQREPYTWFTFYSVVFHADTSKKSNGLFPKRKRKKIVSKIHPAPLVWWEGCAEEKLPEMLPIWTIRKYHFSATKILWDTNGKIRWSVLFISIQILSKPSNFSLKLKIFSLQGNWKLVNSVRWWMVSGCWCATHIQGVQMRRRIRKILEFWKILELWTILELWKILKFWKNSRVLGNSRILNIRWIFQKFQLFSDFLESSSNPSDYSETPCITSTLRINEFRLNFKTHLGHLQGNVRIHFPSLSLKNSNLNSNAKFIRSILVSDKDG